MAIEINQITSIEEAESMIAAEEERKQAVYLELGKQYFVRHSTDCEPELKSYVDELVSCSGNIAEINRRILALKGPTCPTCGAPVNEDSIFCSGCGTRLKGEEPVIEEPAVPDDVVICSNCGSEMRKDMRFCTACGSPMADQEPAPQAAPTQEYIPEPAVEQEQYFAQEPVAEAEQSKAEEPVVEQDPYYVPEPVVEQEPYYAAEPAVEQDAYEAVEPASQPKAAYVAPEPSNICPVCGAISAAGINFCVNCGNPLTEDIAPAAEPEFNVRRCPNCGFVSSDPNMPFCTECGTLLN